MELIEPFELLEVVNLASSVQYSISIFKRNVPCRRHYLEFRVHTIIRVHERLIISYQESTFTFYPEISGRAIQYFTFYIINLHLPLPPKFHK